VNPRIYVSTGAFPSRSLAEIIELAQAAGISNLELSSGIEPETDLGQVINSLPGGMQFLMHNYFPPEETGLVINLASGNAEIREKSIEFCENSIEWCRRLGIPSYSVHAGFCIDPTVQQLGNDQASLPRIGKDAALRYFYDSLLILQTFAEDRGILFCVENNVIEPRNLIDEQNLNDLLTSPEDFQDLMAQPGLEELAFLIDLGHLKVAANAEGFSLDDFVDLVAPRTRIIHLSDNDASFDRHDPIQPDAWCLQVLDRFRDASWVLETRNQLMDEIITAITRLENDFSEII